ncbi:hypothetical protein [Devosia sp. A449]
MINRKTILVSALALALLAIAFPPWGFLGQDFDHFAFALRNSPKLTGEYSSVNASIAWHLLGLELAAIALVGAITYVLAPSDSKQP